MDETREKQYDPVEQSARLMRINLSRRSKLFHKDLAKRLGVSRVAVTLALNGRHPQLLKRVARHLDRVEREMHAT